MNNASKRYEKARWWWRHRGQSKGDFNTALKIASGIYGVFDGRAFPIGTRLTSKENGELIPATRDTPDEYIVGIVK